MRSAPVSVVIPVRNRAFAITAVLDALAFRQGAEAEVVVVDDASEDDSAFRAAAHPSRPTVVVLRELASRATDDLVLLGFRQHVPFAAFGAGPLAPVTADIEQDPRVDSLVPAGPLPFSGDVLDRPTRCRLLDSTDDLLAQPMPVGGRQWFLEHTSKLLRAAVVVTRQPGRIPFKTTSSN